jgi:hypothetical protein
VAACVSQLIVSTDKLLIHGVFFQAAWIFYLRIVNVSRK